MRQLPSLRELPLAAKAAIIRENLNTRKDKNTVPAGSPGTATLSVAFRLGCPFFAVSARCFCYAGGIEARFPTEERPFVCGANLFHAPSLREKNVPAIDTWQAQRRYETMDCFLSRCAREMDLAAAQGLLAGEHGFLCQYDPSTGRDTLWSVAADLGQGLLYRAEENPSLCAFKRDIRLRF